jgi:hypothetical protein
MGADRARQRRHGELTKGGTRPERPGSRQAMSHATLAGCGALVLWAFLAVLTRLAAGIPPLQMTMIGFAIGGTLGLITVAARGRLAALRQPPIAWAHGVGGLFGYHALYFLALALAPRCACRRDRGEAVDAAARLFGAGLFGRLCQRRQALR